MGPVLFLKDIATAILDMALGRVRRRFVHWIDVAAPRATVWELLKSRDVTFEGRFPIRVVGDPVPGRPGVERVHILAGNARLEMMTRVVDERAGEAILYELLPEGTDPALIEGRDDFIGFLLADAACGTRLELIREISPISALARLSIPLGLRSGARRYKRKAEAMWLEASAAADGADAA